MATDISERLLALGKQVAKLRDTNPKTAWKDIATQLEIGQGKVMLAYLFFTTDPKDRIKDTPAAIVKARNSGLSWAIISARAGIPESTARKIFEKETGESTKGNRIGKGGRYPGDANPSGAKPVKAAAKKIAPAKKAPAKKVAPVKKAPAAKTAPAKKVAPAKKAAPVKKATKASNPSPGTAAGGSGNKLADLTFTELKEKLEGRGISVERSGKVQQFRVKTVKAAENGTVEIIEGKGMTTRTFRLDDIKKLTSV